MPDECPLKKAAFATLGVIRLQGVRAANRKYLVGEEPASVYALCASRGAEADDSTTPVLGYPDGSAATIEYLAGARLRLPKERWEVPPDGRSALCDNFRKTQLPNGRTFKTLNQDKGQQEAVRCVVEAVREGRPSPIPLSELVAVSQATLRAAAASEIGRSIPLTDPE